MGLKPNQGESFINSWLKPTAIESNIMKKQYFFRVIHQLIMKKIKINYIAVHFSELI
jgi:hypothetical protein